MKQKFTLVLVASFFFGTLNLLAQNPNLGPDGFLHCGTDEQMHKVFAQHPELQAEFEASQALAEAQDAFDFQHGYQNATNARSTGNSAQTAPAYIIPIVFHIIHDYGSENISDAQVLNEVQILNKDYRKLNADTSAIRAAFLGVAADAQIEFRLANIDPNGNCTNGIDRIYSTQTYIGDDGSKLNYWPRNKYLNVWVVKAISNGAAGYAYLPNGAPSASVDGIIILSTYIGAIGTGNTATSRALTHEIGHFLNLQHVWGNTNNPGVACGNDGVNDTPVTKGWTSCVSSAASKVCNASIEENIQNYMEYSYCSNMFSLGQRTRMQSALNSQNGQRNQLCTPSNLIATGVNNNPANVCSPVADFLPNDKVFVCIGGSISFQDFSTVGHPTSWNWSFPGGTPSTSTDSFPIIQYNTAGIYAVTLTVANGSGSNSLTRSAHVKVSSATAQYNSWQYVEGMEVPATFSADYTIVNPQGNAWTRITTSAATGTASLKLTNTAAMAGTVDEFVGPSIDMSALSSPVFTFKVAYRQRASTDTDKLRVYVSTNCGQTWLPRYTKSGTSLATGAATTSSSYAPTGAEWRTETVNISNILTQPNIRFKFSFESAGGNSIYIDDINITGISGIDAPEVGVQHFDVFPNPVQENTMVSFSLDKSQNVSLQLFDMTGRVVLDMYNGILGEGNHQFPVQTAEKLSNGLYFVRLTTAEGRSVTQKLIVE